MTKPLDKRAGIVHNSDVWFETSGQAIRCAKFNHIGVVISVNSPHYYLSTYRLLYICIS